MGAFAALGYPEAMNLLLFGGGIVGAVVNYFFAKMFGK